MTDNEEKAGEVAIAILLAGTGYWLLRRFLRSSASDSANRLDLCRNGSGCASENWD